MGTKADFYVGIKDEAEWLGSIGMDGYPEGPPLEYGVILCVTEEAYRDAVAKMLAGDEYSIKPSEAWPWPWPTSDTTDYAYTWYGGTVKASIAGYPLMEAVKDPEDNYFDLPRGGLWPKMF